MLSKRFQDEEFVFTGEHFELISPRRSQIFVSNLIEGSDSAIEKLV